MLEWSKRKECFYEKYKARIIISNERAINICFDKWNTYNFLLKQYPTPGTSLSFKYDLIKPRIGRGSAGIVFKDKLPDNFSMDGKVSQEIVKGIEYTIDVLCDFNSKPIYIIPRKRLLVQSGLSVKGVTIYDDQIIRYCRVIVDMLKPIGIINIQCFKDGDDIFFIEINPRIAGGSSLSFASTENWFKALECFVQGRPYEAKEIIYGRYMFRTFEDVIIDEDDLRIGME